MTARLIACHSILQLDARHPAAAKSLLDAQAMHRLVMSGFRGWVEDGQPDARAQMGILSTWNLDLKTNTLLIVIQSKVTPDWTNLPKEALTAKIDTINVDQPLRQGDTLTFRTVLSALNTRRDLRNPERAPRKLPQARPEHVRDWLLKRSQPPHEDPATQNTTRHIGGTVEQATLAIRMLPPVTSNHHEGLKIIRSEIRGKLTITDPTALHTTLADGIGSARAYSCGLLLVRPS